MVLYGVMAVLFISFSLVIVLARTGATNDAELALMRTELGLQLAPIEGGDGSAPSAMVAIAKSSAAVLDQTSTRINVRCPLAIR